MNSFFTAQPFKAKLRVFVYSRLLILVDHRAFGFASIIFLTSVYTWRLLGAFLSFIYARREIYSDLYLFHFSGFLKDFSSLARWSRLGDFLESLKVLGPSRVIRFVSRPATKLAQLESAWYWKSNPAMWLPDKMWNDIVDSFDRNYLSGAKKLTKRVKRELENFADYPYVRLRAYALFVLLKISKFRFPKFRFPRFFGQFLADIRLRFAAVVASRSMLIYHGLGRNAVLYGKVPSFMVSPVTFDLAKKKIVLKQTPISPAPSLDIDKVIEEEILAKLSDYPADPSLFANPLISVSEVTGQQSRYKRVIEILNRK